MLSYGTFCFFLLSLLCGPAVLGTKKQLKQFKCPHSLGVKSSTENSSPNSSSITPIIFVYTVGESRCSRGFHDYIKITLEQAIITQIGAPVILASNYRQCNQSIATVKSWHKDIIQVDTDEIASPRTKEFFAVSTGVFQQGSMPDLWGAAAQRFFILEVRDSLY